MTYWVQYSFSYQTPFDNGENRKWVVESDFGSGRFHCRKKDIKREVETYILEEELYDIEFRDLRITIIESYATTDTEV